jgi:hypothetical protein
MHESVARERHAQEGAPHARVHCSRAANKQGCGLKEKPAPCTQLPAGKPCKLGAIPNPGSFATGPCHRRGGAHAWKTMSGMVRSSRFNRPFSLAAAAAAPQQPSSAGCSTLMMKS